MSYGVVKPLMNTDDTTEFGHQIRRVTLKKQSEIRIHVDRFLPLKFRVVDGKVEIFGSELPPKVWLTFPPLHQFAVFTWYGATIEIVGVTETEYTSNETPMVDYQRVNYSLHAERRHSVTASSQGPRVIIVGAKDSGKGALAKMLLSWAAKDGWKPTFVDLNVGQSSITIPGTIAAISIEMQVDPVEGFPLDKALVHYFGHISPRTNIRLYQAQVEELAREVEEDFAGNAKYRASGMVIDTMGWIDCAGYALLVHAIRTFKVSLVLVLGQDTTLVNNLNKDLRFKKNLQILNLKKSAGVFSRDSDFRKTVRNNNIQKYFHGATNDLTVYTKTAKFSDVQVYQIGDLTVYTKTAKFSDVQVYQIGDLRDKSALQRRNINDPLKITPVKIDKDLVNKVLAISYAKQPHQIISSIVAGFVCIKDVNIGEESITYTSPSVAELPSKILILGSLTWHEIEEQET